MVGGQAANHPRVPRPPMQTHPFEPRLVHPLPQAPVFLGRDAELAELRRSWLAGSSGVLALVGLGGAGKTALAARFLAELIDGGAPRGLFVWSFYQEPDADLFLRQLHDYLARGATAHGAAKGAGLLHLMAEAVSNSAGRLLLVLDGLERVQRQSGQGYGQVDDPLLKAFL